MYILHPMNGGKLYKNGLMSGKLFLRRYFQNLEINSESSIKVYIEISQQ
jgi:hypothetical protein